MKATDFINKYYACLVISFSVLIFGIFAHGYCYFNSLFNHDSLAYLYTQSFDPHIIGIGRIFRPLLNTIMGNISSPSLIGLCSLIFIMIAVYFTTKILSIKKPISLVVVSGLFVTYYSLTLTYATYIHDACVYMLAMSLSVISVWIIRKHKFGWLFSPILLCLSLGIYQAMLQCAIFLLLVCLIFDLLNKCSTKQFLIKLVKYLCSIFISLVLYYISFKLTLFMFNVAASTNYNSLNNIGNYGSFGGLINNLILTYTNVFYFFVISPITSNALIQQLVGIVNLVTIILVVCLTIYLIIKINISFINKIFAFLVLLTMPFAINFVCFVSQGLEYELMVYSFVFIYVYAVKLTEVYTFSLRERIPIFRYHIFIPIFFICIFCNIMFSNNVYLEKNLIVTRTNQIMNRVIDRIEQTPNYSPGKTPVAFVGSINESKLFLNPNHYQNISSLRNHSTITYQMLYSLYLNYYLNYPICLLDTNQVASLINKYPEIKTLENYPNNESIKYINDILVVKIADVKDSS